MNFLSYLYPSFTRQYGLSLFLMMFWVTFVVFLIFAIVLAHAEFSPFWRLKSRRRHRPKDDTEKKHRLTIWAVTAALKKESLELVQESVKLYGHRFICDHNHLDPNIITRVSAWRGESRFELHGDINTLRLRKFIADALSSTGVTNDRICLCTREPLLGEEFSKKTPAPKP